MVELNDFRTMKGLPDGLFCFKIWCLLICFTISRIHFVNADRCNSISTKTLTAIIPDAPKQKVNMTLLDFNVTNVVLTLSIDDPSLKNVFKLIKNVTTHKWQLKLAQAFNSDEKKYDNKAINMNCNDTRTVTVKILLIFQYLNTYSPKFIGDPYVVKLNESTPINNAVFFLKDKLKDMDYWPDSSSVYKYFLLPKSSVFDIELDTGNVLLRQPLDFESQQTSFEFVLLVEDQGDNSAENLFYNATTNITFLVTNDDDLSPKFTERFFHVNIFENVTQTTPYKIEPTPRAIDGDHLTTSIIYSLADKPTDFDKYFEFHNRTMTIKVKKSLDQISTTHFQMSIMAYQADRPKDRYDMGFLAINVFGINKYIPEMTEPLYKASVREYAVLPTLLLQVDATDKDGNLLEYKMQPKTKGISLNKTNGLITLTEHIDPKVGKIVFQVWAKESVSKIQHQSTPSEVTITIIAENDHNPVFSSNKYTFSILQTAPNGILIGMVSASDPDPGLNGVISYEFVESSNIFEIDPQTGKITSLKMFNETKVYKYTFMVSANDNATIHSRSTFALVEVNIVKENVFAPEFPSNMTSQISILESTPQETIVLDVFAKDNDHDNLIYAVKPNNTFGIKSSTKSGCSFLYLKKELDADTIHSYTLQITASDTKHKSTHTLKVAVLGVNDIRPSFESSTYSFGINENRTSRTVVGTIKATDKDINPSSSITYSLLEDSDFNIDPSTGVIRSQRVFNILKPTTISFVAFANDHGLPKPLVASCLVNIIIADINDHIPEFNLPSVHLIIKEDKMKNLIYHLEATDKDIDPKYTNISYDIQYSTSSVFFKLENKSDLYLKDDQESKVLGQMVSVIVEAFDTIRPHLKNTIKINISFQDMNNKVPRLDSSRYQKNVSEDATVGSTIFNVQFSDDDVAEENKRTDFSIVDWSPKNPFLINANTGVISLWRPLDADGAENKTFTFTIRAENTKTMDYLQSGTNFTEATVEINVINVNDNPPTFAQNVYLFRVSEVAHQNETLFQIPATDIDNDKIRYSLAGDVQPFISDPSTGDIKLAGNLDYDKKSIYNFSIRATDEGHSSRYTFARVYILVKNMNNKAPIINNKMILSILEEQPKGTLVGCISAFDPDGDKLLYSTDSKDFSINSTSSELKSQTVFDYESQPQYRIVILVSDGLHKTNISVMINVIDINDHQPQFGQHEFKRNITDFSQGSSVIKLSAKDGDKNDNITYSLIGDSDFEILPIGEIVLAKKLDWRTKESFISIMASAIDSKNSSTSVLVSLLLVKPAEFARENFTASISEAAPLHTIVFQLEPCDFVDRTVTIHNLEVDLSNKNVFYFDKKCSCVRTNAPLDRETQEFYEITMMVKDQHGTHRANLRINVKDVNDEHPILDHMKDVIEISDDSEPESFVIQMNATDKDKNNGFTFFLEETYGKFTIDKKNGVIRTSDRFNYRLKAEYNLTVFVIDHGLSPLGSNQTLTIRITNSNKYQPMFNQTLFAFSVNESAPAGLSIGQVSAHDNDKGTNGQLIFRIIYGNENDAFAIGKSNGTVWVHNSKMLDYEKTKIFNPTLEVKDSGINPKSSTATLLVNLEDINDNSPEFKTPEFVSERLPIPENTPIFIVHAKDADSKKNGYNTIEYSQLNLNKTFSTDRKTGVVTSQSRLSNVKIYIINFEACDKGGNCVRQNVQLSTYSNVANIVSVDEGIQNAFVIDINATDGDSGVFYTLTSCHEYFTINSSTGIVRTQGALVWYQENNKLPITVVAKYSTKKNNQTQFHIIVQIVDVNDHVPEFPQKSYTFQIPENTNRTFDIAATDLDGGKNALLTYSFFPSEPQVAEGSILLNLTTGTLNIYSLDRENQAAYTFNVMAKDGGHPPKDSTTKVTIELLDLNDNAPIFTNNLYRANVDENSPPQKILTVHADDKDIGLNGAVYYEIQDKSVPFIINQFSGEIWSMGDLDFETNPIYNMQVLAIDQGSKQYTSTCSISIQVLDSCDEVPQLTTVISLLKDKIVGTEVFALKSSDNGTNYNISAGDNIVAINEHTGSVFTNTQIPNTTINFDLTITAWSHCNLAVRRKFEIKAQDPFPKTIGKVLKAEITENSCSGESIFNLSNIEEYKGKHVSFELESFKDFFKIENGGIHCKVPLDREKYSQVVLLIGVTFEPRPIKYTTDETLKIVVTVNDINDHSPHFQSPILFYSIPATAQFFSYVGKIKVTDEDVGENGISQFSLSGKDNGMFYINPSTGELHTLFEAAEKTETKFNLEVMAVDQNGNGLAAKAPLKVFIYSTQFNLEINVDKPVDFVEKILDSFVGNLSQILGFKIMVDQVQVHQDSARNPDLQGSDILFHALDLKKKNVVSKETVAAEMNAKQAAIDKLLAQFGMLSSQVKHASVKQVKKTTTNIYNSQVTVIVLACIIFVGCILGILITVIMTKRVQKKLRDLKESKKITSASQNEHIEFTNTAFDDAIELTNQEILTSEDSSSTTQHNGNLPNQDMAEHNQSFYGESSQPNDPSAKDGHPSISDITPSPLEKHVLHQSPSSANDEERSGTDAIKDVDLKLDASLPVINSPIKNSASDNNNSAGFHEFASGEANKNQKTDLNTNDIKVQIDVSDIEINGKTLNEKPVENGNFFILQSINDDTDDITEL